MKTFKDLKFENGFVQQAKLFFNNGYGVSVIIGKHSYGGIEGLYELAVLKGKEDDWDLCYTTKITDDVIGYLSPDQVTEYMKQVQQLKE